MFSEKRFPLCEGTDGTEPAARAKKASSTAFLLSLQRALLMVSRAAIPCSITGMVYTGCGTLSVLKERRGSAYTHSVMRSWTAAAKAETCSAERALPCCVESSKRRDTSQRVTCKRGGGGNDET